VGAFAVAFLSISLLLVLIRRRRLARKNAESISHTSKDDSTNPKVELPTSTIMLEMDDGTNVAQELPPTGLHELDATTIENSKVSLSRQAEIRVDQSTSTAPHQN
jgi:hypothetical protein